MSPDTGDPVTREVRPQSLRRRLLAVTAVAPWPPRGGFSLRVARLLESLSRSWDISLVVADSQEPAAVPWAPTGPHEVISVRMCHPVWAPSTPFIAENRRLRDAVDEVLARRSCQAVLLWPGIEFVAFGRDDFPPAVADRIDSDTLKRFRAWCHRKTTIGELLKYAAYERRVVRQFAAAIVVGQDDARALTRISGSKNVVIVPNGVVPQHAPCFEAESPRPTVVFSGTLNYYANVDAVRHFARYIWPDIHCRRPDARLLIVGRTPTRGVLTLAKLAGVEVRADVPDMARVLREGWVAVAPMRLGSGVKNKVLEAWAAGRPVVLSPRAANGLDLDEDMRRLVTGRRKAFAALVLQLLSNQKLRHSLGAAALSRVRARHSWQDSAEALSKVLQSVSGEINPFKGASIG